MPDPDHRAGLYPALLKHWRHQRGMSQLDLAVAADVSARHISFLETGRSTPSPEMVLQLATTLGVPLRQVNAMLRASGHEPVYDERDDRLPPSVTDSLQLLKRHHEPFPLVVVDRTYTVLDANRGALAVLAAVLGLPAPVVPTAATDPTASTDTSASTDPTAGADTSAGTDPTAGADAGGAAAPPGDGSSPLDVASLGLNLARLTFDPAGAQPHLVNFEEVGRELLWRIQREVLADPDDGELRELLDELLAMPTVADHWRRVDLSVPSDPALVLHLRRGAPGGGGPDLDLRFLTTVTAFQAPQNVAVEHLRIETWFPYDDATAAACRSLAEG